MQLSLNRPALALAAAGAALTLGLAAPHAASAQTPSGKFRVTATGFNVTNGTWDDALQRDGKCDEVYLQSELDHFQKSTGAAIHNHYTGRTHGDTNGFSTAPPFGRILAGSCTGLFQPTGGLQHGDGVTMNETLFEGTLARGDDSVVVTPSLWEWDSNQSPFYDWVDWAKRTVQENRAKIEQLLPPSKVVFDWAEVGLNIASTLDEVTGESGTRPIGMKKSGGATTYTPQALALNYDSAALYASQGGDVQLQFVDDSSLWGNYTLKLKITRLDPPVVATPTPAPTNPEPIESPTCRKKPSLCDM
jgi:hypothetical protein